MTLNLFLINADQAIVLSDRRLIENGRLVNSQATKIATIIGLDGRAVMAFTGLARYGVRHVAVALGGRRRSRSD